MIRLFRVSMPVSTVVLVLTDAAILIGCYILGAFMGLNESLDPWFYFQYENGWVQLILVVGVIQGGMYLMDLYDDPGLRMSRILLFQQLSLLLGISFLIQALTGYARISVLQLPRWTMVYGSFLALLAIPLWRTVFYKIVRRALPSKKLLFLGLSPAARGVIPAIQEKPDLGYQVIGYMDTAEHPGFPGVPWLGPVTGWQAMLQEWKPHQLVLGGSEFGAQLPSDQSMVLRQSRVELQEAADLYEAVLGRVSLADMKPSQHTSFADMSPITWKMQIQNAYSLVLGLIGLVLSGPIMLVVALLVKTTSAGPAIYKQERVGLYGKSFFLYKFRSMYIDAEARTGPVWATKNDPRITPLGRWLRLLRFDELPQFFNVIRGDMALVGPRPERPKFCEVLEKQVPFFQHRHLVKPGITGWAQINHSYTDTVEGAAMKLEYDLYYVKHLAPALDAYIIFHTLKVMLLQRGAQ